MSYLVALMLLAVFGFVFFLLQLALQLHGLHGNAMVLLYRSLPQLG
jgi:hypothetical protein